MASTLTDLPIEVLSKIFFYLSAALRDDHERGIQRLYEVQYPTGMAAGYIRLGFQYPLPLSLLLSCRRLSDLALDYVFRMSPLRVDVAEDNEGAGTYDHYDEQTGSPISYVSEKWTMLARRLTVKPKRLRSNTGGPLAQVAHITDHPYSQRLRSLHVNHWIYVSMGKYLVSGNPVGFVPLVNGLTGLRQLVVFLDITQEKYIAQWDHARMPNSTAYPCIEFTPVVRVASQLPGGSPVQLKYIVTDEVRFTQPITYSLGSDAEWSTSEVLEKRLKRYLGRESANGISVGLFYSTVQYLAGDNYAADVKKYRSHTKCHNPGDLGTILGCSLRPGQPRPFTGISAWAGSRGKEITTALMSFENADIDAAKHSSVFPPSSTQWYHKSDIERELRDEGMGDGHGAYTSI